MKTKVAIVTGGSRGIGLGIVENLIKRGYKVAVCSRHQKDLDQALKTLVKKFKSGVKSDFLSLVADVSHEDDWSMMVKMVLRKWGRIDALVNNAGIVLEKDIASTSWSEMMTVMNVNLVGDFLGIKAVLSQMKKQKSGRIVNIASIAGLKGFAMSSAYCSSKFAIVGLTKVAALELAPFGIRVNAVCPGIIDTAMTKNIMDDKKSREGFLSQIPMGRAGEPVEVGALVAFLADEESSYCNGGIYTVDGGFTA